MKDQIIEAIERGETERAIDMIESMNEGFRFHRLFEDIPQFMEDEDVTTKPFRASVFAEQVADSIRHVTHDPEINPNTRPLSERPEIAFSDVIWQFLCLAHVMEVDVEETLTTAHARMMNREGYLQQRDDHLSGYAVNGEGQIRGKIGYDILSLHEIGTKDITGIDTSYFECILTEVGGMTSHAANIARENDIPCVVGINGLCDSFDNGDEVVIDLDSGTVRST